jgi:hypothetical protein
MEERGRGGERVRMVSLMFSYSNGTLRPDMPLYQYLRKFLSVLVTVLDLGKGNHCIYRSSK